MKKPLGFERLFLWRVEKKLYFRSNKTRILMAQKLNRIIFTLREGEDFIPLISLLKACDVVYSGSEAQEVVTAGMVLRNGEVEYRKRAKITAGEVVVFENYEILVEGWD